MYVQILFTNGNSDRKFPKIWGLLGRNAALCQLFHEEEQQTRSAGVERKLR
jgi:hypothetical protein